MTSVLQIKIHSLYIPIQSETSFPQSEKRVFTPATSPAPVKNTVLKLEDQNQLAITSKNLLKEKVHRVHQLA